MSIYGGELKHGNAKFLWWGRALGTPRDGAAIEITGLLYSTLRWITKLKADGLYKWDSVKTSDGKVITFVEWANKVKENFEKCYYVPKSPEDDKKYVLNSALVKRRGVYKDLFGGGKEFEDYQLRYISTCLSNLFIWAMVFQVKRLVFQAC